MASPKSKKRKARPTSSLITPVSRVMAFFHKMAPEKWSEVIRADLDSVFNMSHQVFPGMRERGYGRIVNISSINGQKGQAGQTNYSAAKAGMIGFTRASGAGRRAQGRYG